MTDPGRLVHRGVGGRQVAKDEVAVRSLLKRPAVGRMERESVHRPALARQSLLGALKREDRPLHLARGLEVARVASGTADDDARSEWVAAMLAGRAAGDYVHERSVLVAGGTETDVGAAAVAQHRDGVIRRVCRAQQPSEKNVHGGLGAECVRQVREVER